MTFLRYFSIILFLAMGAPAFAQQCNCIVPATCKVGIPVNGQCVPIAGSHLEAGVSCVTAQGIKATCTDTGLCQPFQPFGPCKSPDEGVCTSGGTYDANGVCTVTKYPDGTRCEPNGFCRSSQCIQVGTKCKQPNVCRNGAYDAAGVCQPTTNVIEDTPCLCANHTASSCAAGVCQCPPKPVQPKCKCGGLVPHCLPCR